MKRFLFPILIIFATACQTIDPDQRLIEIGNHEGNSSVLLVEFSGVGCVNCPLAAIEAAKLKETYDTNLVVVEMHPASNPFTQANPQYDYTSDDADTYYKYFNGTATTPFPTGVINLSQHDDDYFTDHNTWGKHIALATAQPSKGHLLITASTDSENRTVNISATLNTSSKNCKIMLWLVENNIVGAQAMPDGTIDLNYNHNHVFRQSLNTTWGEPIANNQTLTRTYSINETYQINNCSIVGIITDENNQVIATTEIELASTISQPIVLSVNGLGTIKSDTSIVITDYESNIITGEDQMEITGMIGYEGTLQVLIERQHTEVDDQFCCGQKCINTNQETIQLLTFTIDKVSSWYAHLTPQEQGEYTVKYTFNPNNINSITLTIKYRYK